MSKTSLDKWCGVVWRMLKRKYYLFSSFSLFLMANFKANKKTKAEGRFPLGVESGQLG